MKQKFFKTKKAIRAWLDKYEVEDYSINEDLTVDIDGHLNLIDFNLKTIPIKFNSVSGDFECQHNNLTSLAFSPKIVLGSFDCSANKLTSLEFCPETVGRDFYCHVNELTSLKFSPKTVNERFWCGFNQLSTLEFCPEFVGWDFVCHNNQLISLEFCPIKVGGKFYCYSNPALGDQQDITDFSAILNAQAAILVGLEKNNLDTQLAKAMKELEPLKKTLLKV